MALVLEVGETRDGITVSRGGEQCVLRTFGLRGDTLLLGLDYGRPQLADIDLPLDQLSSLKLLGVEFRIKVESRRGARLAFILMADRSLNFTRLNAKGGGKKAA